MVLKWRAIGAALVGVVLVLSFDGTAAHASSPAGSWDCTKNRGDRKVNLSNLSEEHTWDAETNATGVETKAYLCVDASNNGWYWAVYTNDTNHDDGLCAHAGLHWRKSTGAEDIDYGMWVCAKPGYFYTPTRNGTRYQYMYLTAFVDGQSDDDGGWHYYVSDLL